MEKDCWNTSFQQSYTNKVVWELFLQCDAAHRSTLLSIGNLGIDLCCRNIFMTEVTLHHHNACSCVELETGEAVPAAVESYMLGYLCIFQPVLQWCLRHGVFEIREHLTSFIWWIAYQFQGFLTDWVMHDVLCLLHSSGDIHYTIAAVWLYFFPSELLNVAFSQCRKTGEQKGSLQSRSRAWCGCQADNLVLWKMLLVSRDCLDTLQETVRVLLYLAVTIGSVDWSTESYLSVFPFAHQQFKQVWLFSVWHRLTNNWLRNWYVVFYF